MYTVKQYTDNKYPNLQLTDLFIASVNAELWDTKDADLHQWVKEHQTQFSRYEIVAKELNLRLIKMYTNYFWYICGRDWKIYHHLFTHNYITMASVLALKKLWRIYFFASATPYTIFDLKNNSKQDTDRHELLSNHVLSTPDFLCFSGGIKADRIQKTYELADYPLAQKVLHPCHKKGMKNCSEPTCDKCLRGLLVFDYYGKLDNMKEVFDVNRYKRDRKHYLWQLVAKKDNEFFTELYKMFCEKYPEEMRSVRESYEKFISPVPARDFRVLQKWYNFTLQLMLLPQPTEVVKNFFKSKGINKLYCTGGTNIGNRIKQIISDDIKCVNYINSKVSECDAAMILDTIDSEISKKKDILSKQGAKKIYTLYDLELLVKTLLKDVH